MICPNCNEEVRNEKSHRGVGHYFPQFICSPKISRSETASRGLPSMNCSAGAGADAHSDSLINSVVQREKAVQPPTINPNWQFPIGGAIASLNIIGPVMPEDMDALAEMAILIKRQLLRRAKAADAPPGGERAIQLNGQGEQPRTEGEQ